MPALVLGSTQPDSVLDAGRAREDGWEVCRRRSGGGLVVIQPGKSVWIDVFIPPSHPEWSDDVGHAFAFIGRWWLHALRSLTSASFRSHSGPLLNPEIGRLVCFGGIGPGEVLMAAADPRPTSSGLEPAWHKVVGLSQRRSRAGARFQGLALLEADDDPVVAYGSADLRAAATQAPPHGWPSRLEPPAVTAVSEAFLDVAPDLPRR